MCSPISSKPSHEKKKKIGLWREEAVNPASWNSLVNSGKNLKLAGVPRNKPKACTSNAMIYHQPYQLLLSSSCQLGQPNGWLKCMCGHPRVKWRLWLWQKMDSCGRAYSLIQRNVIDMLLCFIIAPPAPQHITMALPNTAIWQMSSTATTQGDMTWFYFFFFVCFAVVWKQVLLFWIGSFSFIF